MRDQLCRSIIRARGQRVERARTGRRIPRIFVDPRIAARPLRALFHAEIVYEYVEAAALDNVRRFDIAALQKEKPAIDRVAFRDAEISDGLCIVLVLREDIRGPVPLDGENDADAPGNYTVCAVGPT